MNRYQAIFEKIFFDHYRTGATSIEFSREEIPRAEKTLGLAEVKNRGDALYTMRYRGSLSAAILATQPPGREWIIEGSGRAKYAFRLVPVNRIVPNAQLAEIKMPDATPEIVSQYALSDEQALLAKVRYNRLVDIFLGLAAYSLQNHLRTTVPNVGQVEIDELYVAVDRFGRQFVIPVQAKGGKDQLSVVQTRQDLHCCRAKFPHLICRTLSAQFVEKDLIALFELTVQDDTVKVAEEKHYRLVPADRISLGDLAEYSRRSA